MAHFAARTSFRLVSALAAAAVLSALGCGSSAGIVTSNFGPDGGDAAGSRDATTLGNGDAGSLNGDGGNGCVKPTCADLKANCGKVTDPKCGGVVSCGDCPSGQICGGGGVHNQCGAGDDNNGDACIHETCASQGLTCGAAGDGCGGMLQCGTCNAPQACGGDPAKPGQCGCTGTCALVPNCGPGDAGAVGTTLSGTVLDPAGNNPIYNALVYIPNNPSDVGLQPFGAGVTCDVCGATAAGDPLVSTHTAPDGTFTLENVPVGSAIPLVIELGRWRRQFTLNVGTPCAPNSVTPGTLTMPKNHTEGDIPRIGILTGGFDPLECVLRKIGVDDSEFTNPGGAGHIQFYKAASPNAPPSPFGASADCPPNPFGGGATIDSTTPGQATLFSTPAGGPPTINQYDLVVLACEGYEENEQPDWANLGAYTTAGGRVFMTDYAYSWLAATKSCTTSADCGTGGTCVGGKCTNAGNVTENPAFAGVANWHTAQDPSGAVETCDVDKVSNPVGTAFDQWLENVDVSAPGSDTVSIEPVFHNSDSVIPPTQQWLYWGSDTPLHYTFNAPLGAASANQCGRLAFSDWHADTLGFSGSYPSCGTIGTDPPYYSNGLTFPAECDSGPMTAQEAILEFMIFDISTCVQPYTPVCTPRTCADQHVDCGPAGDGCGNALSCGTCGTGQVCGGGGAGKCGTASSCTPETCASQHLACGPAGDGCGHELECGTCATGGICGLSAPGQCGSATPK